jgi:hypothetical protein
LIYSNDAFYQGLFESHSELKKYKAFYDRVDTGKLYETYLNGGVLAGQNLLKNLERHYASEGFHGIRIIGDICNFVRN